MYILKDFDDIAVKALYVVDYAIVSKTEAQVGVS